MVENNARKYRTCTDRSDATTRGVIITAISFDGANLHVGQSVTSHVKTQPCTSSHVVLTRRHVTGGDQDHQHLDAALVCGGAHPYLLKRS